jgi:hypothetical protein
MPMPVATAHHHHFCFVFFSFSAAAASGARRGAVITNPAMDELLGIGYCHLCYCYCWLAGGLLVGWFWWLFGC